MRLYEIKGVVLGFDDHEVAVPGRNCDKPSIVALQETERAGLVKKLPCCCFTTVQAVSL